MTFSLSSCLALTRPSVSRNSTVFMRFFYRSFFSTTALASVRTTQHDNAQTKFIITKWITVSYTKIHFDKGLWLYISVFQSYTSDKKFALKTHINWKCKLHFGILIILKKLLQYSILQLTSPELRVIQAFKLWA